MNAVLRRLFREFVNRGGDLTDAPSVARFVDDIDVQVSLMPPRLRMAMEVVLKAEENVRYLDLAQKLSELEGREVNETALRQRVSRGMRELEDGLPWPRDRLD